MRHVRLRLLHAAAIAGPWVGYCCITSFIGPGWLVSRVGRYLPEPVHIQAFSCMGTPVGTADEKALYLLHQIGQALLASSVYGAPVLAVLLAAWLRRPTAKATRDAWPVAMASFVMSQVALQSVLQFGVWAVRRLT